MLKAQLVVGFVVHLVLAERDVTDGKVIEVPPVGGLKARHGDVSLGVELLGNPPADGSSSTPYSLLPAMLSGSIPKKLPTPQDGSRMLPVRKPICSTAS